MAKPPPAPYNTTPARPPTTAESGSAQDATTPAQTPPNPPAAAQTLPVSPVPCIVYFKYTMSLQEKICDRANSRERGPPLPPRGRFVAALWPLCEAAVCGPCVWPLCGGRCVVAPACGSLSGYRPYFWIEWWLTSGRGSGLRCAAAASLSRLRVQRGRLGLIVPATMGGGAGARAPGCVW